MNLPKHQGSRKENHMMFTVIFTCVIIGMLFFLVGAVITHDEIMMRRITGIFLIPLGLFLTLLLILIAPFELIFMKIRINKMNKE